MPLTIRHVDTCLPCFVLDHCNGETEALIGVPVDCTTTYADLREALESEIRWTMNRPEGITISDVASALFDLFEHVTDTTKSFDPSLDPPTDGFDGESCFAWFRMSWGDSDA